MSVEGELRHYKYTNYFSTDNTQKRDIVKN